MLYVISAEHDTELGWHIGDREFLNPGSSESVNGVQADGHELNLINLKFPYLRELQCGIDPRVMVWEGYAARHVYRILKVYLDDMKRIFT